MAKRSQRRSTRCEKDQSGCMWSLISIFDFRQGRITRKLISDRKRGNRHAVGAGYLKSQPNLLTNFEEKCKGTDVSVGNLSDGKGREILAVEVGRSKKSVKKLMDEEISSIHIPKKQITSTEEQRQSGLEHGGHFRKTHKCTSKTCNRTCDIHVQDLNDVASLEPPITNIVEEPSNNLDLARAIEEFCSQIHQFLEVRPPLENERDFCDVQNRVTCVNHDQIDELSMQLFQKQFVLQGKLSNALEVFMNQKFIDGKHFMKDGALHQSKQFMNAIEILNSKKEKFINGKHIEEDGVIRQSILFMDVLEMLNSNKELFLKLLQDSNSVLTKHVQDLQDAQKEKVEPSKSFKGAKLSELETNSRQREELVHKQLQKQSMHNFFRRKIKSQDRNPSKGSIDPQASNRIVVLKPDPAGMQISDSEISCGSSPQSRYNLKNNVEHKKIGSHFSFKEIRRKLKDAMGENKREHHRISMDGMLHKIPYECQDFGDSGEVIAGENVGRVSPSKTYFNPERTAKPSIFAKNKNKNGKPTDCELSVGHDVASTSADRRKNFNTTNIVLPRQRESNVYLEAKKHLSEMLSTGEDDEDLSRIQVPRTLGRILSLPEYNLSPICSPGRDREHSFVTARMRFSPFGNFHMVNNNIGHLETENSFSCPSSLSQNLEVPPLTDDSEPNNKPKVSDFSSNISNELHADLKIHEGLCYVEDDFSTRDDVKILETMDTLCPGESNVLDMSFKANNTNITSAEQSADSPELCEGIGYNKCSRLDSPEENQTLSSSSDTYSPGSLISQKVERQSPVSVLELLIDDVISPAKAISQTAGPPMQPLQIHFEEHDSSVIVVTPSDPEIYLRTCTDDKKQTIEYIRAVLQASGLNWNELMWRWCCSSEQLLHPSLFDEVEDSLSELFCVDQKLVFDCINEVLLDTCKRYFGCSPWVSIVKPNIRPIPLEKSVVYEVLEGIDWHLFLKLPSHSVDQIIGKDMAKAETWTDLGFDTEDIGIEMGELILKELIDDTTFEFCS